MRLLSYEERLNRVTNKNMEREQVLRELFEKAGCAQEQLIEQHVKGGRELPTSSVR